MFFNEQFGLAVTLYSEDSDRPSPWKVALLPVAYYDFPLALFSNLGLNIYICHDFNHPTLST